ncbi:helicase RepA family protein [Pseudomonas sp. GNP012]
MNIDLFEAFEASPPMLDFIWPGFLAGTVGALIAPGATGKSYWALEAAMGVACTVAGGDILDLAPPRTGKVLYIAGEDPAPALTRRVHAIGQHLEQPARRSIAAELTLSTVMGEPFNVMERSHFRTLTEQAQGYRLIVLDTLSRIHQLDENSNSDMSRLISRLEQVAATTGASVLFLHHVSKSSARDGFADQQQAARGASSLIDNARWCGYVAGMTEEESKRLTERPSDRVPIGAKRRLNFVRFGVSKQNYDPTHLERWYSRQSGGVLMPVSLIDADTSKNGRRLRDEA